LKTNTEIKTLGQLPTEWTNNNPLEQMNTNLCNEPYAPEMAHKGLWTLSGFALGSETLSCPLVYVLK
jgi:hypothetical protein